MGATVPKFYSNSHELNTGHIAVSMWGVLKLQSEALGVPGSEGEIHCTNVFGASVWNENGQGVGLLEGWGTNACVAPQLEKLLTEIYGGECGQIKCPITVFATAELPEVLEQRQAIVCEERSKVLLSECPKESEREETAVSGQQAAVPHIHRGNTSLPWKIELVKQKRSGENANIARIGVPPAGQSCEPKEEITNEEGNKEVVPASWEKVPAGCVKIDVVAPEIPSETVFYGTLEPKFTSGVGNGLDPSIIEFNAASGYLVATEGRAPETKAEGEFKVAGAEAEQLIYAK